MKKTKKNNKGFSLVELIVVVLILGILAVAVTPQVMKWVDKSKISTDKDSANALKASAQAALAEWQAEGGTIPKASVTGTKDCVIQIDKDGTFDITNDWGNNTKGKDIQDYFEVVTAKDYPKFQYKKLEAADISGLSTDVTTLWSGKDVGFFIVLQKDTGKITVKCKAQTITD